MLRIPLQILFQSLLQRAPHPDLLPVPDSVPYSKVLILINHINCWFCIVSLLFDAAPMPEQKHVILAIYEEACWVSSSFAEDTQRLDKLNKKASPVAGFPLETVHIPL